MPTTQLTRRRGQSPKITNAVPSDQADDSKKDRAYPLVYAQHSKSQKAMLVLVTILGFFITFYKIWYPAEVVFDEVHFGKFAGHYLKRAYFFDVHPPLAKLMIAAVGYLIGYGGHFDFANIGDDYVENNVPYIALRALPASLNVLSVSLIYSIMKESGYSTITCVFTSCMYIFDNAIVGQNRLIMLDSMLIFFMLCCVYCYIRFRKVRHQEFSKSWYFWLFATGVTMALTLSVKMVGLFLVASIGIAVLIDLWDLLDIDRGLSTSHFMKHFRARALGLIVIPVSVYLFWFYVHFAILTQSGPGDTFMSSAFQETLANSAIKMKSLDIRYFDNITLKHKATEVFLHSHDLKYPLRYDDGRISSQGQQVTGVKVQDDNCWWRILPTKDIPEGEEVLVHDGDVIRLEHTGTGTILLTHDVASPILATNEEVTTVPHDTRYNETLFQVHLDDSDNGNVWQTHMKKVRLVHMDTKVAIWTHELALPDWALGQQDVNGNKNNNENSNYWVAEEIQGLNATEINAEKKKEIKTMFFLRKFVELQGLMLSHNAGLTKPHPYQSSPETWPAMRRGISYWSKNDTSEQIYLTGNVVGWYLCIGMIAMYGGVTSLDLIVHRRGGVAIDGHVRQRFINSSRFFFILWALHYLPFFVMGRALFLHHYLPAATCGYLFMGAFFQFLFVDGIDSPVSDLRRNESANAIRPRKSMSPFQHGSAHVSAKSYLLACIILAGQCGMFIFLAPLTYGSPGLSVAEVNQRKLFNGWDLQFAK